MTPRYGAATFYEDIPPKKGGWREAPGGCGSAFPSESRHPPEGFAFFPPFIRGIFEGGSYAFDSWIKCSLL